MFEAGDLFVENLTSAAENNEQAQGGIIKAEASRSCVDSSLLRKCLFFMALSWDNFRSRKMATGGSDREKSSISFADELLLHFHGLDLHFRQLRRRAVGEPS